MDLVHRSGDALDNPLVDEGARLRPQPGSAEQQDVSSQACRKPIRAYGACSTGPEPAAGRGPEVHLAERPRSRWPWRVPRWAAYYGLRHTAGTATPAPRTVTAQRGVVLSTVSATGNVTAPTQLNVNFETGGRLVALAHKQGQRVKRGQVLARLDDTSARVSVQTARASLQSAEAHLQQLIDGETPAQRAQDAISVTQAQMALANAKAALGQTKAGNATSIAEQQALARPGERQLKRDQRQLASDRS